MSLNIKRTQIKVNNTIFNKCCEQAVDCDLSLPDYCGEISRILKCFAQPNITSSSVSGDRIIIDGTVTVRLLYVSDGELSSFEHSSSFSKQIDIDCDAVGAVLEITTANQYINCRAVSPRKVEVHGSFAISAKLSCCCTQDVLESADGDSVQIKKDTVTACSVSGSTSVNSNVSQVVDIGTDLPKIKSLIRNTAVPEISETKQISNKVLVKGELKIKTLYKSEDNQVCCVANNLPISQIVDIDGVTENSVVDLKLNLSSFDISMKPNAIGAMCLLDIAAIVNIQASAYDCVDFPVITDAYSTDYASTCSKKRVSVDRIINNFSKCYTHHFIMEERNVCKVVDFWCDNITVNAAMDDDKIKFFGTVNVYALIEDENGTTMLQEEESEFCFKEEICGITRLKCSPSASLAGCDYTLDAQGISTRVNIHIRAVEFDSVDTDVVDEIQLSDEVTDKKTSLFIYYCEENEDVWSIARKYNTTEKQIMEANNLTEEIISEPTPLLIWSK